MPRASAGSLVPGLTGWAGLAGRVAVGPVWLLGVRVVALARPSLTEHERRSAAGLGAVTNPALLDRLLDLPAGQPVGDPVVWAETSGLPAGIVDRDDDGYTVTRLLEPPLALDGVVVPAGRAAYCGRSRTRACSPGPPGAGSPSRGRGSRELRYWKPSYAVWGC